MKKLINFRPILFIALSLCAGIMASYFYILDKVVWCVVFCTLFFLPLAIFLIFFTKKQKIKRNFIFAIVLLLFFAVGLSNTYANVNRFDTANLSGQNYSVVAKIVDINKTDSGSVATLDNCEIKGERTGELYYKIRLTIYGESNLDIGSIISFNASLCDYQYLYEDVFNANALESGIKYYASVKAEQISVVDRSLTIFERMHLFLRNSLDSGLEGKEFGVAYALITGNSTFMDNELLTSYRNAGVAHIFAVSGLHIGFLAVALSFVFKKIPIKPIIKTITITAILFFYSGVCGFSASSLRASIMTAVGLFALNSGKRYDGISALSLSAIIILLFNPIQLLCVGFQLSFIVVLGIITCSGTIAKLFKFLPKKIADSLGVVFSAQLFSIPVCLYAFGQVSLIAVIINLIFVPIVSIIFTLTLVLTIIGGIFSISSVLLFPLNYVFMAIDFCINLFDYKIFLVGGITLGGGAFAYYLIFLVVAGMFNLKIKAKTIVSIILTLSMLGSVIGVNVSNCHSVKAYVVSSDSISATLISIKDQNTLIVSDVNHVYSTQRLTRLINKTGQSHLNSVVLMGGYNADMQVFLTKLLSIYSVENLYYYGEKQEVMEQICAQSFPSVQLKNFMDNQTLPIDNFSFEYYIKGKVLVGKIGEKKMAIFSKLGSEPINFEPLGKDFSVMICLDRADGILTQYSPKTAISYKYSSKFKNAQSYGNIYLKLT